MRWSTCWSSEWRLGGAGAGAGVGVGSTGGGIQLAWSCWQCSFECCRWLLLGVVFWMRVNALIHQIACALLRGFMLERHVQDAADLLTCAMLTSCCRQHDPKAVEPYLSRCFPAIKQMKLSHEWGQRIESVVSPEGENLLLRHPVNLQVRISSETCWDWHQAVCVCLHLCTSQY